MRAAVGVGVALAASFSVGAEWGAASAQAAQAAEPPEPSKRWKSDINPALRYRNSGHLEKQTNICCKSSTTASQICKDTLGLRGSRSTVSQFGKNEKNDKNPNVNPRLQYHNSGKSVKRDLNRGPQHRNFESAKTKVIDSIALLRPPSSDRTTVSQI